MPGIVFFEADSLRRSLRFPPCYLPAEGAYCLADAAILAVVNPELKAGPAVYGPFFYALIVRGAYCFKGGIPVKGDGFRRTVFGADSTATAKIGCAEADGPVHCKGKIRQHFTDTYLGTKPGMDQDAVPARFPKARFNGHWDTEACIIAHGDGIISEAPDQSRRLRR